MSDLSSMTSASQDALIDAIDFSKLGRPTASYMVDRRTVRVPFLAPKYSTNSVTVMRANIGDAGWVDPATVYMSCLVHNDGSAGTILRPLTTLVNGCFQRARQGSTLYDWLGSCTCRKGESRFPDRQIYWQHR